MSDIGFDNKRKEIIKMLIADFGYQNGAISIGSTDENIISFAKKIDQENNAKVIESLKSHIENSIQFLLRLKSFKKIKGPAKKRSIKLFLLISNRKDSGGYINIKKMNLINFKLSEYNGQKARKNPDLFKERIIKEIKEINSKNYKNFEDLFYLFQGSKKINDYLPLIEF